MDWYVIQAYSGYEVKVKAALEEKIQLEGLEDKFGEILVPTEQIVELKSGAKRIFSWIRLDTNGFRGRQLATC